jgi:hypothetical protein
VSDRERVSERSGVLIGVGGLALAVCCIAVPVLFGVVLGAAIGNALDIGAAVLIAVGVAIVLHRRRAAKGKRC